MLRLALAVFFVSGFAALLYQVIWQRMLAIFSGADVYSATVTVAAFMAGLGIGHLAGGHVADRVSQRASLALFACAELAIAAFGASSAALYYEFLYQRLGEAQIGPQAMSLVLFGSLLWPTFFMGASLPLLARAMTATIDRAASTVGALYGFNTLGAALGALIATWWLLPQLGLDGTLRVGAWMNVGCAAVFLPLAFRAAPASSWAPAAACAATSDGRTVATADSQAGSAASGLPRPARGPDGQAVFWFWAVAYAFAGFVALSLEIVWFRLLGVVMKSTAFTFGTLLSLYLAGLGLGALAGSVLAPRVRRPGVAFFGLQAAGGVAAAGLLTAFVALADDAGALRGYFGSYEPLSVRDSVNALRLLAGGVLQEIGAPVGVPSNFLRLYVGVPLLLIVPPTFLMGASFPLLQRVIQTDIARVGRRVGGLLLANIVGSILGTVATGWLSLAVLGTAGTLKLLVVMSGLFAVGATLAATDAGSRRVSASSAVSVGATVFGLAVLLAAMPSAGLLWARLHGTTLDRIIVAEDHSGVSVIKMAQEGFEGRKVVFVNGVGQSTIPYGDIHTVLGALPAFVHPDPKDAAIIGLGSGDTAYAVAGRPGLERITCIEIIGTQLDTLRELTRRDSYGGLQALLADPRIEHVFADGRRYLMRAAGRYDIIEADALRPTSAYSGNLYSDAYFRLVRDRLKPNGLAATWAPTERVHSAFVRVFPYVLGAPGVLIGSSDPIAFDREAIARRLADPRVREHYARAGIDIEPLLESYLRDPVRYGPDFPRETLTDFNTDLFPRDEYDLSPLPR